MSAVLRTTERDRLVERLQGVRMPPIDPATARGLDVVDGTGIQRGNADLADSCAWAPPGAPSATTPLPGHEHDTEFER